MGKKLTEVSQLGIYGDDGSNYIYIEGYLASNIWNGVPAWNRHVVAWGGDDFIVFHAHMIFNPMHYKYGPHEVTFDGGSGTDTVSLAPTQDNVTADLTTGTGMVHIPSYVYYEDGAWNSISKSIPWAFISVENFYGGMGNDEITGNSLNNVLNGGFGSDKIWGEDGNDRLEAGHGHDEAYGGQGNDTLLGGEGWDYLYGDEGNDSLMGGNSIDALFGGIGNDILNGGAGTNYLDGGFGLYFVKYTTAHDVIVNLLDGTGSSAIGTDQLVGIENVHTGDGDDVVYGDAGRNTIWLGDGDDWAYGYNDDDTIKGHDGDDRLFGENGNDQLWGNDGDDKLWGASGADGLRGGKGDDDLYGGYGKDTLKGEHGDDLLEGEDGNDVLIGGNGEDTLSGGDGDDTVDGGAHADLIYVTNALDVITTGTGSDTLFFLKDQTALDIVTDFDAEEDYFAFEHGMFPDAASINLYTLAAIDTIWGDATLYMRDAAGDWKPLLVMQDVDANDINMRIHNGTMVKLPPLPDVEGGFQFEQLPPVAPTLGSFEMF